VLASERNAPPMEEAPAVDDCYPASSTAEELCPTPGEAPPNDNMPGTPLPDCPAPEPASGDNHATEAQAPKTYTIALNIQCSTEVFASMVCLESATKTAILTKARVLYRKCYLDYEPREDNQRIEYSSKLLSVQMGDTDWDLSTSYDVEDMTFMIETISNTEIPGSPSRYRELIIFLGLKSPGHLL
jgi:hypothetical protein